MSGYLDTVRDVYAEAARQPDPTLCCLASPVWRLPGLNVPPRMLEMNYGCGSVVDPRDLRAEDTVLYVGVGGGLEALQFAYLLRRPRSVIAVDPVAEMREQAVANLREAAACNPWFRPEFVEVRDGSALDLPLEDEAVTVAAQNCLFNVFAGDDLARALAETYRVLAPGGRFFASDPVTPVPLPEALAQDHRLRARCISGCQTLENYLAAIGNAGFGRIEVRARVPYRLLTPAEYPALERPILLESVEVVAVKQAGGSDGVEVFLGQSAVYAGSARAFDDGRGQILPRGVPVAVSAAAARRLGRHPDIVVTPPTYFSRGQGCC
jgi:SAM-dependent methyltransferase